MIQTLEITRLNYSFSLDGLQPPLHMQSFTVNVRHQLARTQTCSFPLARDSELARTYWRNPNRKLTSGRGPRLRAEDSAHVPHAVAPSRPRRGFLPPELRCCCESGLWRRSAPDTSTWAEPGWPGSAWWSWRCRPGGSVACQTVIPQSMVNKLEQNALLTS